MLTIRKAVTEEFVEVRAFYHELIDRMQSAEYKPGWEKGVYPSDDYLQSSISKGQLYIGLLEGTMVSAMIVNASNNSGYVGVNWGVEASDSEIHVIHALGVMPGYSGQGFAKAMVKKAIEISEDENCKAVRLDVLSGNTPAEKLYVSIGFKYIATVKMFYEDTGLTDFLLYEYVL